MRPCELRGSSVISLAGNVEMDRRWGAGPLNRAGKRTNLGYPEIALYANRGGGIQ